MRKRGRISELYGKCASQPLPLTKLAQNQHAMARILDDILSSVPATNGWKLDQKIDFEHRDSRGQMIPHHLGRIADSMTDWEGVIADHLGLSEPDRSDIRERNPREPTLQR